MEPIEKKKVGGLAGIVAGDSSICLCGVEEQSLLYRGYSIEDLASNASFEEVAYLLTRGQLPNRSELAEYTKRLISKRDLPKQLKEILETIPSNTNMMDVMRTGCSLLGNFEPEKPIKEISNQFDIADKLIACFPSMLMYWDHFQKTGKRISLESQETTIAGYILDLLYGKAPEEIYRKCIDVSLILYAEHEFNASTFTVRTIASTLPDFYSAICGGIGALRGPLHGGANEWAMALMNKFHTVQDADNGIHDMLARKELIMGFGHRVYTTSDPRSAIIKSWAKKLSELSPSRKILYEKAECIERIMWEEKKLFPNLDFYSALSYHFSDIPTEMFTPLFVMSRITGWSAHLLEQRTNNKLIRPNSHYIGPFKQKWIPLNERK